MPTLDITGTTSGRNAYEFRASGPVSKTESSLNDNDAIDGNEVRGGVSTGTDTIVFDGVPTSFKADSAWELDIQLDMGGGPTEVVPTLLNAIKLEVRSQGAHYYISIPAPGMILKGAKADPKDGVLDVENQLVAGNVRNGGSDDWRIWPPVGFDIVADNETEVRLRDPKTDWVQAPTYAPNMEF
jgi:hypothetical protein